MPPGLHLCYDEYVGVKSHAFYFCSYQMNIAVEAGSHADFCGSVQVLVSVAPGGALPRYASSGAAGMDLCAIEKVSLDPMERKCVGTGVKLAIPPGYEGQVRPRSGLALRLGLGMVNSVGTIDSDYRGEVGVILINLGKDRVQLDVGERIAQLIISPVAHADLIEVAEIPQDTARGENGFGSTGTR
jgi:dUTP pyrophosphatase